MTVGSPIQRINNHLIKSRCASLSALHTQERNLLNFQRHEGEIWIVGSWEIVDHRSDARRVRGFRLQKIFKEAR
jgi:hypothetical protein